jgi:DNA primase catalytic core, N-terminal domain
VVCDHPRIEALRETQARPALDERLGDLLADAAEFFETCLWESRSGAAARETLARADLDEEVIREFGVGFAPIGPDELMDHLRALGYATEEMVAAGLATRSVRGRAHAHFRSRIMFPVRDSEDRVLGFAGLGTHMGPSWALWTTSPDAGLYRRSEAVFGLDRAGREIAASGTALVLRDSIEVLRAHQEGRTNAVAVHTPWVTRDQMLAMVNGLPGGLDALELDLSPGIDADSKEEPVALETVPDREATPAEAGDETAVSGLKMKRVAIMAATALAAVNIWTGAPLLAVWIGSQAQGGRVLSLRGVLTVLLVLGVLSFLLGWALSWLHARYDQLVGRPTVLTRTSPWQRRMRGELDDHLRARYPLSAPERVVAACVIACLLVFEIWFFFFAGSPLGS